MKNNKKIILFGAGAIFAVLGIVDMFTSGNDTPENFVIKDGVMTAVEDLSNTPTVAAQVPSSSASNPSSNVLAPRMVGVPSYDAVAMAARIYNEAINQNAAKEFIALQPTRRNARLQAEVQALYTKIKESEAAAAEADARRLAAVEGKVSIKATDMTIGNYPGGNYPGGPQNVDDNGNVIQGIAQASKQIFRMTGFNEISKTMSFQLGDQWFTGVKSGQTIDGYLVGVVDEKLKCVPLMKGEQSSILCMN